MQVACHTKTVYLLKMSAIMRPWGQTSAKASSVCSDPAVALHALHLFVIRLEVSVKGAF